MSRALQRQLIDGPAATKHHTAHTILFHFSSFLGAYKHDHLLTLLGLCFLGRGQDLDVDAAQQHRTDPCARRQPWEALLHDLGLWGQPGAAGGSDRWLRALWAGGGLPLQEVAAAQHSRWEASLLGPFACAHGESTVWHTAPSPGPSRRARVANQGAAPTVVPCAVGKTPPADTWWARSFSGAQAVTSRVFCSLSRFSPRLQKRDSNNTCFAILVRMEIFLRAMALELDLESVKEEMVFLAD